MAWGFIRLSIRRTQGMMLTTRKTLNRRAPEGRPGETARGCCRRVLRGGRARGMRVHAGRGDCQRPLSGAKSPRTASARRLVTRLCPAAIGVLERWGQGPPRKRVGCEARARCVEVIIKKPTPGLAKRRFARGHRGGWLQSCPVEASPFTTVLTWDDYASRITSSLGTRHADDNGQ